MRTRFPTRLGVPWYAVVAAGLFAIAGLAAHEGPEAEIEELTESIARGETSDLLLQRAIEYRVLGKNAEAARDLERALQLDAGSLLLHRELGRVYFAIGKTNEAIDIVTHALRSKAEQPTELAALRALRAEFLGARSELSKALQDCEDAIRTQLSNVEWYLLRSDLHRRLKQRKERIAGIEQGLKETGAGILAIELVEAQLDDGRFKEALPQIEAEIKSSRIKGSWLIRRARARLGLGDKAGATEDLTNALDEINPRLSTSSADGALLTDKARALELLGETLEARKTYEKARDAGAEEWVKEKIKALKAEEEAREKK